MREFPKDDGAGERQPEAPTVVDVVKFEEDGTLIAVEGQKLVYAPAQAVNQ